MTTTEYAHILHEFILRMEEEHPERASMARTESVNWYDRAYQFAEHLSHKYHISVDRCIGIISAFSIRQRWSRNMLNAELFIRYHLGLSNDTPRCFGICSQKSEQIMECDGAWDTILSILRGKKITRFARVIRNKAREACVVIDSVMCRVFKLGKQAPNLTEYRAMESAVMLVADSLGMKYHVLQAYAWILMRGKAY